MISGNPRFTVAITAFQRPELLMRALLSVAGQDYPHWDCVIYSDGPAPRALAMAREFVERSGIEPLTRTPFFELERKEGLWGNHLRRRALKDAKGDYCVILGHDCELLPHCLSEHASLIAGREGMLSIVGVHVWNTRVMGDPTIMLPRPEYLGVWPKAARPKGLEIADVDLTCMAFPVPLAHEAGCFAEDDQRRYAADYLAYRRMVDAKAHVAASRRPCAVHF